MGSTGVRRPGPSALAMSAASAYLAARTSFRHVSASVHAFRSGALDCSHADSRWHPCLRAVTFLSLSMAIISRWPGVGMARVAFVW